MARTHKEPEPITQRELAAATTRLRIVLKSLEEAAEAIGESRVLAVNYGKSLGRGIDALESFEPELRRSLALYLAGTPMSLPSADEDTTTQPVGKPRSKPPKQTAKKNGDKKQA